METMSATADVLPGQVRLTPRSGCRMRVREVDGDIARLEGTQRVHTVPLATVARMPLEQAVAGAQEGASPTMATEALSRGKGAENASQEDDTAMLDWLEEHQASVQCLWNANATEKAWSVWHLGKATETPKEALRERIARVMTGGKP